MRLWRTCSEPRAGTGGRGSTVGGLGRHADDFGPAQGDRQGWLPGLLGMVQRAPCLGACVESSRVHRVSRAVSVNPRHRAVAREPLHEVAPLHAPKQPNVTSARDFTSNSLKSDRGYWLVKVPEDDTREALAIAGGCSLSRTRVVAAFGTLRLRHCAPNTGATTSACLRALAARGARLSGSPLLRWLLVRPARTPASRASTEASTE